MQPQQHVWIVARKTQFDKYKALKVLVMAVAENRDSFKGLAWLAAGLPLTDWCTEGPVTANMDEASAKNIPSNIAQ